MKAEEVLFTFGSGQERVESATRRMETGKSIRLRIEGMNCGSCVAHVERALRAVPGVRSVEVNLTTESANIHFANGAVATGDLVNAVRDAGYDAEPFRPGDAATTDIEKSLAARLRQQRQATLQAVAVGAPVMAIHWLAPLLESHEHGGHIWPHAVQALLCLFLLCSSAGAPILVGGMQAILHGVANMDLLIGLGVSVGFIGGTLRLILGGADFGEFDAVAMILAFINVGRLLELRARHGAGSAIAALTRRIPSTAHRVTDRGIETVPIDLIRVGDRIRAVVDTFVPVDGEVIEGQAAVDESAVTGEPLPRNRGVGDAVVSGSIIREGTLVIRASHVGVESTIGRIVRTVEEAQAGKTRWQRIADRVAGVFVPVVIVIAIATLFFNHWRIGGGWLFAVERAIAVMIIACPCAMGLATPAAVLVATGAAALQGILVRDAAALEAAGSVDWIMFDKTGTLTTGRPFVQSVFTVAVNSTRGSEPSRDEIRTSDDVLSLAASVEQNSQHPLAKAIVNAACEKNLTFDESFAFESFPGRGARAVVKGETVLVGSPALLREQGIDIHSADVAMQQARDTARSVVLMALGQHCVGSILINDSIRKGASEAFQELRSLGIGMSMVTGDSAVAAHAVADSLGIADVLAERLPEEKLSDVRVMKDRGHRVAFVGDGINDAPSLAGADVGITFASATDVAVGAATITIVHHDLRRLPLLIRLARRSVRVIRQNLFWAFFYNILAIPLAATGRISPGVAAACMMFSSLSVVLNSLRLRRVGSDVTVSSIDS
ncbi:MAG: cation-translocating P-type ATPase [Planctomycetes bacterium]|nr:cation-translocating P-type ATPase [Planctomycetota bacterium]